MLSLKESLRTYVCAALWDALGESRFLVLLGCLQLLWVELATPELVVQFPERDALHHINWVDDIAKRLRPLASFRISN